MIRLLIADDEPIEREAIRLLISNHFQDITVVGEAENGFEAYNVFCATQPNLVLMDINMPGIDGIETIRQMTLSGIKARYIIVTSYSKFEYAKKAIQLGVDDYVLKPAALTDIQHTLERIKESIQKEGDQKQWHVLRPIITSDIVRRLSDSSEGEEINRLFNVLSINPTTLCVFIVESRDLKGDITTRIATKLTNLGYQVFHDAQIPSLWVAIVFSETKELELHPEELRDYIQEYLGKYNKIKALVFSGLTVKSPDELPKSWAHAYDQVIKNREPTDIYGSAFIDSIVLEILAKNRDRIQNMVAPLVLEQHKKFQNNREALCQSFDRLTTIIKEKVASKTPYYVYHFDESDKIGSQLQVDQPYQTSKILEQELFDIITEIEIEGTSKENPLLQKIEDYLSEYFRQAISLETLANHLKVSPSYASRLVKNRMGSSFSECLTKLRLEESKRLLKEGEQNVKEIAHSTGFASQHYFSRVFKKYTGYAPSDYLWSKQSD